MRDGRAYVIKLDIKGYFMSLPRKKVYERIDWGLKQQLKDDKPLLKIAQYLWKETIFDDPTKGAKKRGRKKDWDLIPPSKSLFCQPDGQGVVIGNLTSQFVSNVYLDMLDRFIMHKLGYKHYGRYVDDFYFIVTEEEYAQAKQDVKQIRKFLTSLGLTLHPNKIYMQDISKGVPFLGAVVYRDHIVPGKRLRANFYQAAMEVAEGRRDIDSVASYLGHCKHYDSKKMIAEIFEKVGWEYKF